MRLLFLGLAAVLLVSCNTPPVVWNPDGRSMTDLRSLRVREGRPSVALAPEVTLYADHIHFAGRHRRSGEAVGRVFLEVGAGARHAWLVEHGYAGRAAFDCGGRWVVLADEPMLEREKMTQIATDAATELEIRWGSLASDVIVRGPTRTDFAKSHPIPPGVRVDGGAEPSGGRTSGSRFRSNSKN